jgi:ferritin-like metal-binding protein YciE
VLDDHLEATREHVQRIENIFREMDDCLWQKRCPAMVALIDDCREVCEKSLDPFLKDTALVVPPSVLSTMRLPALAAPTVSPKPWTLPAPLVS